MGNTLTLPRQRNRWSQIADDKWATTKHRDSTEIFKVDFIDELTSVAAITLTSATGEGVTVSSAAVASGRDGTTNTAVQFTVAQTDGYVKLTVVTSDSQTLIREVHFRGTPTAQPESDYRG